MCMLLPSQVCEYGMKASASVPVSIRAGLLATWVQCKQLLQQPIPSKTYGIEEDVSAVMIYGFYQPGAGPIYLLPDKGLQTLRDVFLCQRRLLVASFPGFIALSLNAISLGTRLDCWTICAAELITDYNNSFQLERLVVWDSDSQNPETRLFLYVAEKSRKTSCTRQSTPSDVSAKY